MTTIERQFPTAASRAHDGAAMFDLFQPGWFKKVSLEDLDMASATFDVSGQLGWPVILDYDDQESMLALQMHGLLAVEDGEYEVLTKAWETVIADRCRHV